ncbi:hypothetical protein ACI65C_005261 [Semiaphis heraclei]
MDANNKPSTSKFDQSDSSDDDDEHFENLSTEELNLKIKTFRNLCFENKINVNNAFDIDMIGYFYSWLEKNKSLILNDDEDVNSFQEISDYLEASAKVYSYRVDNLTKTTSRLVEQFKSTNSIKSATPIDDDDSANKIQKPKRQRMMLTTNDKLRRKPNEYENTFNPAIINHIISSFSHKDLFYKNRPSDIFKSMFSCTSLAEELKASNDRQKEFIESKKNEETIEVDQSFFDDMDVFLAGPLCHEFHGFVAERDKVENSNDDELNGIEYHFDPDNHSFVDNSDDSSCDEPDNNELGTNSNDKDTTLLDELLKCIDGVDRDYSYFSPKLLSNWKGPKAWKAHAMAKALKSCTPSERKEIVSNIDEDIDECTQQNNKNIKTNKKRNQVKHDSFQVNWLSRIQIEELCEDNAKGKEKINARTLQKWDPHDNISDSQTIVVDVKYKFNFLQYMEIKPDWWIYKNRKKNSEASNSRQLDSEDEDGMGDIKSESRMDIAELKKEISDIIDEECVETDSNSEWSSKLSFFNLLVKLRINEREGLSIPIVFVGLLHLANERGLKLFQEHCIINDMEETFIAKPITKSANVVCD